LAWAALELDKEIGAGSATPALGSGHGAMDGAGISFKDGKSHGQAFIQDPDGQSAWKGHRKAESIFGRGQ
jgi:hypothetical protein